MCSQSNCYKAMEKRNCIWCTIKAANGIIAQLSSQLQHNRTKNRRPLSAVASIMALSKAFHAMTFTIWQSWATRWAITHPRQFEFNWMASNRVSTQLMAFNECASYWLAKNQSIWILSPDPNAPSLMCGEQSMDRNVYWMVPPKVHCTSEFPKKWGVHNFFSYLYQMFVFFALYSDHWMRGPYLAVHSARLNLKMIEMDIWNCIHSRKVAKFILQL